LHLIKFLQQQISFSFIFIPLLILELHFLIDFVKLLKHLGQDLNLVFALLVYLAHTTCEVFGQKPKISQSLRVFEFVKKHGFLTQHFLKLINLLFLVNYSLHQLLVICKHIP